MKKWSTVFIFLIIAFAAIGQSEENPTVLWGATYKSNKNAGMKKVITTDELGTYIWKDKYVSFSATEALLERYDNDLNLTSSSILNLPTDWKQRKIIDIFPFAGKLVSLISVYDKAKDSNSLYAQTIDKSTLQLTGKRVLVSEISAKSRRNKGEFDYSISRDSSKILIYSNLPFDGGEEKLSLLVYDENLDLQWEKPVSLPFKDKNFSVESYDVDENGNVYLLGKLSETTNLIKLMTSKPAPYTYVIVAYRNKGEESQQYEVKLGDDFITDLTFRIGNNGDLICAGFYSEHGEHRLKGTLFFKINEATKEMYDIKRGEFNSAFLSQFMSTRNANKKKELVHYRIDKLILRNDGGALIIAEQFFVIVTTTTRNGITTTTTTYHYNDIIAVNINPDGSIAWATKIPKRQIDTSGRLSSYAMLISKGKIYFVYNDHPKNVNVTDFRKIKNFKGINSAVMLVTLTPDGKYEKSLLFSNKDMDVVIRPKLARQTKANDLIIFGSFGKKYKFGKIVF